MEVVGIKGQIAQSIDLWELNSEGPGVKFQSGCIFVFPINFIRQLVTKDHIL